MDRGLAGFPSGGSGLSRRAPPSDKAISREESATPPRDLAKRAPPAVPPICDISYDYWIVEKERSWGRVTPSQREVYRIQLDIWKAQCMRYCLCNWDHPGGIPELTCKEGRNYPKYLRYNCDKAACYCPAQVQPKPEGEAEAAAARVLQQLGMAEPQRGTQDIKLPSLRELFETGQLIDPLLRNPQHIKAKPWHVRMRVPSVKEPYYLEGPTVRYSDDYSSRFGLLDLALGFSSSSPFGLRKRGQADAAELARRATNRGLTHTDIMCDKTSPEISPHDPEAPILPNPKSSEIDVKKEALQEICSIDPRGLAADELFALLTKVLDSLAYFCDTVHSLMERETYGTDGVVLSQGVVHQYREGWCRLHRELEAEKIDDRNIDVESKTDCSSIRGNKPSHEATRLGYHEAIIRNNGPVTPKTSRDADIILEPTTESPSDAEISEGSGNLSPAEPDTLSSTSAIIPPAERASHPDLRDPPLDTSTLNLHLTLTSVISLQSAATSTASTSVNTQPLSPSRIWTTGTNSGFKTVRTRPRSASATTVGT
ncbi:hypothetical protein ABW21_db0209675 [Orbilia brochopaga]|nr:hypothetical protein ABW21_db0209675 [Drechslerella brochopaga]